MKTDIHPNYQEITTTCSCGNVLSVMSTLKDNLTLDVCAKCHPFYTGKQKMLDSGGRVKKFQDRFGASGASKPSAKKAEAKVEETAVEEVAENADASNELEKNAVIEDSKSLPQAEEASSASGIDDVTNAITEPSKNKVNTLSKSVLSKMKKADIVLAAAELGLELDIKLTKVKLLESWNAHFNQHEIVEEPAAEAVAEEPAEETESKPVKIDEQSPGQIIQTFESKQLKDDIPSFRPGDTVVVSVKVREGDRTRLQAFEGVVMNIKNAGLNSAFIEIGRASCRERV